MNLNDDGFVKRLERSISRRRFNSVVLAKKSGLSQASISLYLNGHRRPRKQAMEKLASALKVSAEWLSGADALTKESSVIRKLPDGKKLELFASTRGEINCGGERYIFLLEPEEMKNGGTKGLAVDVNDVLRREGKEMVPVYRVKIDPYGTVDWTQTV